MTKAILIIVAAMFLNIPAYAQDDGQDRGDFISNTISNVFDKVGQYTSGSRDILKDYDKDPGEEIQRAKDPLERKMDDVTIR